MDARWIVVLLLSLTAIPVQADDTETLARAAQNPIANMINLPFQDNINFGYGPDNKVQNVLNIQPVMPIQMTEDWNVITRTIVPLLYQPSLTPGGQATFGMGDFNFTAFLSPVSPGELIWGLGPVISVPTATSSAVGSTTTWGMGPSGALVIMPGNWVLGVLANNFWSLAGDKANNFLLQYFVNYNFRDGWYLTSSPILTANWEAPSGNQWVVPFGAGAGKIFRLGGLPFDGNVSAYYNVVKPDVGPDWTLRLQIALLLPGYVP